MQLIQKAEGMISNNHSETEQVRTLAEKVSEKWQKLMHHAQERHKLVMASNNWFKTADQVRQRVGKGCREILRTVLSVGTDN